MKFTKIVAFLILAMIVSSNLISCYEISKFHSHHRRKLKNIKSHKGLPYVNGNIYYSNWTHFLTKEGNYKMFQKTKWKAPFENTWMSYIYQETMKGEIKPGLLLLTPVEHNRFHHYDSSLRREN
jgi:hypothetical protein